MRVISRPALNRFSEAYPEAKGPLEIWYRLTRRNNPTNFADLRATISGSADVVGECVVFNIGGNKFRLVARVDHGKRKVDIVGVYTHRDYDRGEWRRRCRC